MILVPDGFREADRRFRAAHAAMERASSYMAAGDAEMARLEFRVVARAAGMAEEALTEAAESLLASPTSIAAGG